MRLSDASKIAWTKFRARKLRTIVTSIITAIMLTILVGLSMAYTGVRNSIKDINGLNSDRSLAIVEDFSFEFNEEFNDEAFEQALKDKVITTPAQAIAKYPGHEIIKVHQNNQLFNTFELNAEVDGKSLNDNSNQDFFFEGNSNSISFNLRSTELLEDKLFDGQSLEFKDGIIPVFFDTQSLEIIAGVDYDKQDTAERIKNIGALVEKYKGQVIEFSSSTDQEAELKLRFVGLSPVDSIFEGAFGLVKGVFIPESLTEDERVKELINGFYNASVSFNDQFVPDSAGDKPGVGGEVGDLFELNLANPRTIFEFSNDKELSNFKNEYNCNNFNSTCTNTAIIGDAVLEFDEEIGSIWNFLRYVVLFFFLVATVFLFFTTSKIIGDSRKETGVFRAMGAKRLDIAKIYTFYTLIITTTAYLLSISFATFVMLFINSKSADDLSEVATKATSSFGEAVDITFLGYSPKYLFYIWLVSIAVGLVGSALPIVRNVMIDPIKAMRSE